MTIALIIHNPINELEERSIPISTESFFTDAWQPLAKVLNLQWIPLFQTGVFITNEDQDKILDELILLINNLNLIQLTQMETDYFKTRLDLLIKEISEIFALRDRITIYIG